MDVQLIGITILAIVAFPFGVLCGWKIKKYSDLEKKEIAMTSAPCELDGEDESIVLELAQLKQKTM